MIKNNEPCPSCGRFSNRGVSVDAVIVENDEVLLVKRGAEPFKDFWALPGGYVEWDESVEDAVKRELKEEINATVESLKLIGVYSLPKRHPKQVINLAFQVRISGEIKSGDDATDCRWFKFSEVPEKIAFDHSRIINDAVRMTA